MIVGNDISQFQGNVDFDTLKKNSHFIIVKSSEGTGFTDPKFSRNQSEARRVGLPVGYYHFARPDLNPTAENEADWFVKVIGTLRDGEVLCLDYEANWNGNVVQWCKAFLNRVSSLLNGCKPLIYLSQSLCTSLNWKPVVDLGYGLWIAYYSFDPNKNDAQTGLWKFAAMQQWTDKQVVPGIVGVVDGNVFFGDAVAFKKYGYHGVAPVPPTPALDPCATYKQEIITLNNKIMDLTKQVVNKDAECQLKLRQQKEDLIGEIITLANGL